MKPASETSQTRPAPYRRPSQPLRVRGEVVRRLEELACEGLLRIADPERAALHLIALATFEASTRSAEGTLTGEQITDMVTAGVRAFLDGYRSSGE